MKIIDKILIPINYDCNYCQHFNHPDSCAKEKNVIINIHFTSKHHQSMWVKQWGKNLAYHFYVKEFYICEDYTSK